MNNAKDLREYLAEIREQVCSRCIERPPGGPPCAPRGKRCGIEFNLQQLVDAVHSRRSLAMNPYIEAFHEQVCPHCANQTTSQCPCPLDNLLLLAVEAIETVDERRQMAEVVRESIGEKASAPPISPHRMSSKFGLN